MDTIEKGFPASGTPLLGKVRYPLVTPRHDYSTRWEFVKFSRSQYARGGLPDRAINTLKADHSPRLARRSRFRRGL